MNARMVQFLIAGSLLIAGRFVAPGQIVGYVNVNYSPGDHLIENPLSLSGNDLDTIFNPTNTPLGTKISLWDPATLSYNSTSELVGDHWSVDFTLNPGIGARLTAYTPFTYTFVGTVSDRTGNMSNPDLTAPPPVFSGPNGVYLKGDILPVSETGMAVFTNVIGRLPNPGEQIIRLDSATQTYITSTYSGVNWDVQPVSGPGDALFFNIGGVPFTPPPLTIVPEPGVASLVLLGGLLHQAWRRTAKRKVK